MSHEELKRKRWPITFTKWAACLRDERATISYVDLGDRGEEFWFTHLNLGRISGLYLSQREDVAGCHALNATGQPNLKAVRDGIGSQLAGELSRILSEGGEA